MRDLGETAHLAVLSGTQSMLMAVCESENHIRLSSPVGTLLPLNCTSHGKVFLAWSIDELLETFLTDVDLTAGTSRSLTTIEELKKEIEQIRIQATLLMIWSFSMMCVVALRRFLMGQVSASLLWALLPQEHVFLPL